MNGPKKNAILHNIILISILFLLPLALFTNLGLMPLISDEPTRAVVTLEMILSGNFIAPTINGEFYYNKPPLFNWILVGFVKVAGVENEFIFRLPTVISLLMLSLVITLFARKALGWRNAVMAALMMITSARILFWDSFQGLIDITYSLVTFTGFALLYHLSQRRKWLLMFTATYALAAAGYLMKGLPSIAFQGISLLAWLSYDKQFRKLFSWQHLAGILTFALITGTYYYTYLQTNTLDDVFSTLFDQSNRLSDKKGTFLSWLLHLVTFPFEMIYEFAPWTILLLLLLSKKIRVALFTDKFIMFNLLIFSSNIIIYWISADMRPRYLFMLFPLLFVILVKAWSLSAEIRNNLQKITDVVFGVLGLLGTASLLYYLFWDETNQLRGVWLIIPLLFIIAGSAVWLMRKHVQLRLLFLVIVMLTVRIAFSMFNLQARINSYPDAGYRQGEIMAGRLAKDCSTYVLGDTPFNHDASFYIARESRQIIKRTWETDDSGNCYIADEKNLATFADRLDGYEIIHTFTIKLNETRLFLLKKSL